MREPFRVLGLAVGLFWMAAAGGWAADIDFPQADQYYVVQLRAPKDGQPAQEWIKILAISSLAPNWIKVRCMVLQKSGAGAASPVFSIKWINLNALEEATQLPAPPPLWKD